MTGASAAQAAGGTACANVTAQDAAHYTAAAVRCAYRADWPQYNSTAAQDVRAVTREGMRRAWGYTPAESLSSSPTTAGYRSPAAAAERFATSINQLDGTTSAGARTVLTDVTRASTRAGLLRSFAASTASAGASLLPRAGAVVGTFALGWQIGSALRNMYVETQVPSPWSSSLAGRSFWLRGHRSADLVPPDYTESYGQRFGAAFGVWLGTDQASQFQYRRMPDNCQAQVQDPSEWNDGGAPYPFVNLTTQSGDCYRLGSPQTAENLIPGVDLQYQVALPEESLQTTKIRKRQAGDVVDLPDPFGDDTAPEPARVDTAVETLMEDPVALTVPGSFAAVVTHAFDADDEAPAPDTVAIPAPNPGETAAAYIERLQDLGLLGSTSVLTEADPKVGPDAISTTSPAPGTRVGVGTAVDVKLNPHDAPQPADAVPAPAPAEDPNGCGSGSIRAVDLSPLKVPLGGKFPFGVFAWLSGALGGLVAGGVAPRIEIPMPGDIHPLVMDLAPFSGIWDVIHPVMLICAALSLVWVFAATAMGLGASTGSDD